MTMPSINHPRGEGAIRLAVAYFFHSSKPIREKWPDFKKKKLTGMVILGWGAGSAELVVSWLQTHTKFKFQKQNKKIFFIFPILGWTPHALSCQKYSLTSKKILHHPSKIQMQKLPLQLQI